MKSAKTAVTTELGAAWNRFWFGDPPPVTGGVVLAGTDPLAIVSRVRIVVSLIAILWLVALTPLLSSWFTGNGWLTIEAMRKWWASDPALARGFYISFWNWVDAPAAVYGLHVLSVCVLAVNLAGWGGRVTAMLAWWVVLSYAQRIEVVSGVFEHLLTSVFFYLMLAPGVPMSFLVRSPASARVGRAQPEWLTHVAWRLMLVHFAFIYACLGLSKLASPVWWNGEGIWWLISQAESPLVDWTFLQRYGYLVDIWTPAVVIFELGFALLMWSSHWRPLLNWLAVAHWLLLALITGDIALAALVVSVGWTVGR